MNIVQDTLWYRNQARSLQSRLVTTTRRKVGTVAPGIAPLDPGTGRKCEASSCCTVADSCIVDEERHFRNGERDPSYLEGSDPNEEPSSKENECYQKPDDTPHCGDNQEP